MLRHIAGMVEESVDRVKTEAGDVKLLAVGGGAFLLPDKLEGISGVVGVCLIHILRCRRCSVC